MLLLFLIPFLQGMGIDLYVPSMPIIADYFHANVGLVQQTIGFYMLAFGIGQLVLGILSDITGRRKIIIASALCFTVTSFLAALSINIYLLIIYRFFQGLSIGGLGATIRAVSTDRFKDKHLVKAMTYFSTSWALGPIIGPVIGGYLQHFFNWQADFYFFGIYGALVLSYIFLALPETHINTLPFNYKQIHFSIKSIITHPIFLYGSIMLVFAYAVLIVFNVIGPFLIQNILHYSVIAYSRMALLLGFGFFLGGLLNRLFTNYFKPMPIVFFAVILGLLTSIIMLSLGIFIQINIYIILPPVFLLLLLIGLIFPNMIAKIFSLFPKQGGITSTLYGVLVAIGIFFTTLLISIFKTSSQVSMTLIYVGLFSLCLVFFGFTIILSCKNDEKLKAEIKEINCKKATVFVD
jgi:DHA1 family bicyclomycin/chloramphenicol resistance-like MFS transporter